MPAVVSNATRIWEVNMHWDLHAQCGIWDAKGKGVDIWECIRAREPSPLIRRHFAILITFHHCRLFGSEHSATKQYVLEIRDPTLKLSPQAHSQGATRCALHSNSRARQPSRDSRTLPPVLCFMALRTPSLGVFRCTMWCKLTSCLYPPDLG